MQCMKQSFSILDTVPWVKLGAIGLTLVVVTLLTPQTRVYAQSSPTHTIEPGETLSQIAESYGISLTELMELNSITDPDAIVSGQILVLPAPSDAAPAPTV